MLAGSTKKKRKDTNIKIKNVSGGITTNSTEIKGQVENNQPVFFKLNYINMFS